MKHKLLPTHLYKVVSCLVEYKKLEVNAKTGRVHGVGALAKKYKVDDKTIRRWAARYSRDMEVFSWDHAELLHKFAMKEEAFEKLQAKYRSKTRYANLTKLERQTKEAELLQEELKMYRDLYNDARWRLDESKRANNAHRANLSRLRRQVDYLKVQARRMSPDIEDTSHDVYGESHSSL